MSKKSIAELKRDSQMLDSLMDMISEATYKNDKPIFEALYPPGGRAIGRTIRLSGSS